MRGPQFHDAGGAEPIRRTVRKERITKVEFYRLGGFKNSELFRLQTRGGAWRYYRRVD